MTPIMTGNRTKYDGSRPCGFWRKAGLTVLWILTVIAALGLIAASFGGNISPDEIKGICLMVMTFPAWLLLMAGVTVLDILWCRKALVVCVLTFIACASAIWEFTPLNITRPSLEKYEGNPRFTFLTYNVANFNDLSGNTSQGYNPTISFILKTNADVVNLQEATALTPDRSRDITAAQLDSIHNVYPYYLLCGHGQALLSKYPAEIIHTQATNKPGNEVAVFRLNIEGELITIINVHLQSYGLTPSDKELYKDITKLDEQDGGLKSTLKDVKSSLLNKIQSAASQRRLDTEQVCSYIEHLGGPNVIVAGDFNDVPGCYSLRRLADYNMRQVYPELGFGPTVTYNADRFYFRIDHILYRGDLKPLRMSRGSLRVSDHYPLIATFAILQTDN